MNDLIVAAKALRDNTILAKTIYGEARGEYAKYGLSSLIAVGNVVINRVNGAKWFGDTITEVCLKKWQFSCWNENDPNSSKLKDESIHLSPIFSICLDVSKNIIDLKYPDLTKGANHYYAISMKTPPNWALKQTPTCQIGNHLFFNLL